MNKLIIPALIVSQNCVYGWFRPSINRYLYIGMSKTGLARLLSHKLVGKVDKLLPEDEIHLWPVDRSFLSKVEAQLIHELQPLHQYVKHVGWNPLRSKRWASSFDVSKWKP